MVAADVQQMVAQIHAAPHQFVFEFAGAGSLALWWLHSVGGSSRTVLEASDRYSQPALADLLGRAPEQAVSLATGQAMAQQARARARWLTAEAAAQQHQAVPLLGVACTAAIATDYSKRGAHRAVVAVQHATGSTSFVLTLHKGRRDRLGEETLVSRLVLHALAQACALDDTLPLDLAADETLTSHTTHDDTPLARLLHEQTQQVSVLPDGQQIADAPVSGGLLPGSFNPLHAGHRQLAEAAAHYLDSSVSFELTIVNPDKGTLIAEEIERRLHQFAGWQTLILSRAALFSDKAALFPGCTFVVGYDTAVRLVNPRYYGGTAGMHAAFEAVRAAGCRFLVAGRVQGEQFHTLHDIELPAALADLFVALPEALFRVDLSSTELREHSISGS
jgi:hypothetical protein